MFKFNGITSVQMGVVVEEEDFMKRAPILYDKNSIQGKNGKNYKPTDNYDDVSSSFTIALLKDNVDEVADWLKGKGNFEFNGREVDMFLFDQVEFNRKSTFKQATIEYIRRPLWHDANDTFKLVTTSATNNGNASSKPIIKIIMEPNSVATITVNGIEFTCKSKENKEIIIDCEEMTETDENGNNVSNQVSIGFKYPTLNVGENTINVVGTAQVQMKKRSAYL